MDKKLMMWGGVAIVAIIIIGGVFWLNQNDYSFTPQTTNQENANETSEEAENTQQNTTPSGYPIVASNLTYTAAVEAYKDRRIQFGEMCVPTPISPTFKAGTTIMLDNRANKARTIKLGSQSVSLGAYGFKLVTLTAQKALPYNILVDCGTGQNNATILLQK